MAPVPGLLSKGEVGPLQRAVVQLHHQLPAALRPGFAGFPHIGVVVADRVIGETAGARRQGLLDAADQRRGLAGDRRRFGIAGGKNVQTAVATEAEFYWYGLAGFDLIEHRRVVHRREKTGKWIGSHLNQIDPLRAVGEVCQERQVDAVQRKGPEIEGRDRFAVEPVAHRDHLGQRAGEIDTRLACVALPEKRGVPEARAHRGEAGEGAEAVGDQRVQIGDGLAGIDGYSAVTAVDAGLGAAGADEAGEPAVRGQSAEAGEGAEAVGDQRVQIGDGLAGVDGYSAVAAVDAGLGAAGADEAGEPAVRGQFAEAGEGAEAVGDQRVQIGDGLAGVDRTGAVAAIDTETAGAAQSGEGRAKSAQRRGLGKAREEAFRPRHGRAAARDLGERGRDHGYVIQQRECLLRRVEIAEPNRGAYCGGLEDQAKPCPDDGRGEVDDGEGLDVVVDRHLDISGAVAACAGPGPGVERQNIGSAGRGRERLLDAAALGHIGIQVQRQGAVRSRTGRINGGVEVLHAVKKGYPA